MSHGPGPEDLQFKKEEVVSINYNYIEFVRETAGKDSMCLGSMDFRDKLAHILALALPHVALGLYKVYLSISFLICRILLSHSFHLRKLLQSLNEMKQVHSSHNAWHTVMF